MILSKTWSYLIQISSLLSLWNSTHISVLHSCSQCSKHAPICPLSLKVGNLMSMDYLHLMCSKSSLHRPVLPTMSNQIQSFILLPLWTLTYISKHCPIFWQWHPSRLLLVRFFQESSNTNKKYGSNVEHHCCKSFDLCN